MERKTLSSNLKMWNTSQNLRLVSLVLALGLHDWRPIAERMGPEFNPAQCRRQFGKLTKEFGSSDCSGEIDQVALIYERLKQIRRDEIRPELNLQSRRFQEVLGKLKKIKSGDHDWLWYETLIRDIRKEYKDKIEQDQKRCLSLCKSLKKACENVEKEHLSLMKIPYGGGGGDYSKKSSKTNANDNEDESTEIDEQQIDTESNHVEHSDDPHSNDGVENINKLIKNIKIEHDQDQEFFDSGVDLQSSQVRTFVRIKKDMEDGSEILLFNDLDLNDDHFQAEDNADDDGSNLKQDFPNSNRTTWHMKEAKETLKFMEYHRNSPLSFLKRETRASLAEKELQRKAIRQPNDCGSIREKIETGQLDSDEKFRAELWLYFINEQVMITHPQKSKWMHKFALETLKHFEDAIASE